MAKVTEKYQEENPYDSAENTDQLTNSIVKMIVKGKESSEPADNGYLARVEKRLHLFLVAALKRKDFSFLTERLLIVLLKSSIYSDLLLKLIPQKYLQMRNFIPAQTIGRTINNIIDDKEWELYKRPANDHASPLHKGSKKKAEMPIWGKVELFRCIDHASK